MTTLYAAAALLVLAQILGIYALVTRKADFIFAIFMTILLAGSVTLGLYWLYHRVH